MMKIFKFNNLFLLLLLASLLVSCVNNDKKEEIEIPGGEEEKEVTTENIEQGDWEIAYFTHRVKTPGSDVTARGYSMDGFIVNFHGGKNYMEYNTRGDKTIIEGLYVLGEDAKTITLKYKYKDVDTGKLIDSTRTINVSKLTDKTMIYTHEIMLKEKNSFIQDVFYLRNVKKGPTEFLKEGEKKAAIDPNKLAGVWKVDKIIMSDRSTTSSSWVLDKIASDSLTQINKGSKFIYNIKTEPYSYEQIGVSGKSVQDGTFTINDDVLHYYYKSELEDGSLIDVMSSMAVDMAADGKSFVYTAREYSYSVEQTKIRQMVTQFIRE